MSFQPFKKHCTPKMVMIASLLLLFIFGSCHSQETTPTAVGGRPAPVGGVTNVGGVPPTSRAVPSATGARTTAGVVGKTAGVGAGAGSAGLGRTKATFGARGRVVTPEEKEALTNKLKAGDTLNRIERKKVAVLERQKYDELRQQGVDEVSNTKDAIAMRKYKLRQKKRKGIIRKRDVSLASILFPGVAPIEYDQSLPVWILADLVESKKTQLPFEYYDIPISCPVPDILSDTIKKQADFKRNNIGSRLQGHDYKISPYRMKVLLDSPCSVLCTKILSTKDLRIVRRLVETQYRVMLQLDSLPVLMRSKELNYANRGYPVGFAAPNTGSPMSTKENENELYLYNHLRFQVTYHEDPSQFQGIRITGFDVHPVSYRHDDDPKNTCTGSLDNHPETYLSLRMGKEQHDTKLSFSYEVKWVSNDLTWADRWDVYLVGSPDDDIHYLSIINSIMIVIFLTGAISTILVRTLRKDIAGYNEDLTADNEALLEETGWKLIHGDVFRPPSTSPLLLSIFVGTGAQIGSAAVLTLVCAVVGWLNPLKKGQTLTAILILYVMCGSVAGFISARICKYCSSATMNSTGGDEGKSTSALANWKRNTFLTATALPGLMVFMFCILNIFLSWVGAATAVSFFTIVKLFLLWICISSPLVYFGSLVGYQFGPMYVPARVKPVPRAIPPVPLHIHPLFATLMGGVLPFGSVCIELAFIMSALWLHQYYYVMGFLLVVICILGLTCAQVSVVLCYIHLCAEDYRWWWISFWSCATAGIYLFLYSLWFLSSRMDLVGILPVIVYLTYMGMISICFGLFCGSIGFVASFYFCRTIYGAVKVD